MARIAPLSGFPEWSPAGRIVEERIISAIRTTFELHGFAGIETRAVEPLDQLLRKGETSKEVYVLHRLQEDAASEGGATSAQASAESERRLGLHFDLTVPFARYVLENAGTLHFPFKRYQIQKVWRGERPQDGRFREFVQADIDVVGNGSLPFHFEAELPLVMVFAFRAMAPLGVPPITVLVSNRKVAEGFYRGIGLTDVAEVLRVVDKIDKVGADVVRELLVDQVGASAQQAQACVDLAGIRGADESVVDAVRALAAKHGAVTDLLEEGLGELAALLRITARRAPGAVVADLKIARGLDYYTGSVYESVLAGHEDLGSVCSGGRYDSLASDGTHTYPGVGLSIGVSRLVSRVLGAGLAVASREVPTAVLVAVSDEEHRAESDDVAAALRARGIPADVAASAAKFGKQIREADRRGIPFVWFPAAPGSGEADSVKDIRSGEQVPADASAWEPPIADWWPAVGPQDSVSA